MSAPPRQSSFLPTIKCSTCGREIEISMIGDHVCSEADAEVPPLPSAKLSISYGNSLSDKYDRMPAHLDTNAANGGFLRQGQLTPVSASSGSRSLSPRTPDGRAIGCRGNDFFEPSIATDNESNYVQRHPSAHGSFSSRRDEYDNDPPFPMSPHKPSLLSKVDTISPGPFQVGGNGRMAPPRNAFPPKESLERGDGGMMCHGDERQPSTAASNVSSMSGRGNGGRSKPPQRKDGYGGMGMQDRFEPDTATSLSRAGTFPGPNGPVDVPARTPFAPSGRAGQNRSRSSNRLYETGPDTSRPPPPRKSLVPIVAPGHEPFDLAAEFGSGNPYHTSSASMSSAISSYTQDSGPSNPSSRSSPPRSDGRKPSNTSSIDDLMNDLQSSMDDLQPPTSRLDGNPSLDSRPRSQSRDDRPTSCGWSASESPKQGPAPLDRPSISPRAETDRYDSSTRNQNGRQGSRIQDKPVFGGDLYSRSMGSHISGPRSRGMSREHQCSTSQPSRGPCKACGEDIRGKSISSADGRLTGKYHKACFVCTTCLQPFTTAEIYVLGDKPYCEPHYHRLNDSLCGGCGRGIEGQYLEDEALVKYHVGCFRCGDCGMSLSNGYFEVDGRAFCERDAWKRQPASPDAGAPTPVVSEYPPAPAFTPYRPVPHPAARGRVPGGPVGLPYRPGNMGPPGPRRPPPPGFPRGQRMPPGTGPTPRPQMNKRNTRLGMM